MSCAKRAARARSLAALLASPRLRSAQAELQTDPMVLYGTMKAAYDKGSASGWHLGDELDYFSTVLDAGRAFELRRRDDPENLRAQGHGGRFGRAACTTIR